jgi:2-polyprenyl-6-hydroxyphenyl methylase/3-demethylubiquinone-9 3-methyltransferase
MTDTRFAFGRNWGNFVDDIDDERVRAAEDSLRRMLGVDHLRGLSFLDIGCGSGLFSLAAIQLGALRVRSFDFDPASVAAAERVRERAECSTDWTIERGDATDIEYMRTLGTFDVVYSWGVLHHTGAMWTALDLAAERVAPGGRLFVAIYNDQGRLSRRWTRIKRLYNVLPAPLQPAYAIAMMAPGEARSLAGAAARRELGAYVSQWRRGTRRGMSRWHDLLDWVGGFPFEVASPEEIFRFYRDRGFGLEELTTQRGSPGCNEFVFRRAE